MMIQDNTYNNDFKMEEHPTDLVVAEGTADSSDGDDVNDEAQQPDDDSDNKNSSSCTKRILIGLVLLAFIVFVIVDTQTNNWVRTGIVAFLEWVENNVVAGVFGFLGLYFLATILFVPGSVLTLGAGFVFSASLGSLGWGVLLGTVAVWIGASLGAIASFLLGRYLFRDGCVGRLTRKYTIFRALDNALMEKGLRIMVLLRLSPIVPFNVLNYIAGVTGVRFWHYVLACIAMLPGTVLYVFLGASAGSLTAISGGADGDGDGGEEEDPSNNRVVTISVVVVGVIFGILAIGVTSYYAKQELNKVLEQEENNNNNKPSESETDDGDGVGDEEEQQQQDETTTTTTRTAEE